jgi:hypothetical protein
MDPQQGYSGNPLTNKIDEGSVFRFFLISQKHCIGQFTFYSFLERELCN